MAKFYDSVLKVGLGIGLLSLGSCNAMPTSSGYDQHFYDLVNKANSGDLKAAKDAYDYCTAYLKLDDSGLPSIYLGQCGGTVALWLDVAMQTGDPKEIKEVLSGFEVSHPDFKQRLPYYKKIAKMTVTERCDQASRSEGCADKELMAWFGLEPVGAAVASASNQSEMSQ